MQPFRFKVVCSDIDGTLLNAERQLSAATISAFRSLPDDTVVILASSRMPAAMTHLQEELGIAGYPLICYNGGYVLNAMKDGARRQLVSVEIPLEVVSSIVEMAGSTIHSSLYNADEWYAPAWDYWAEREARVTKTEPLIREAGEVLSSWKLLGKGAHKVMCMGPEDDIDRLGRQLVDQFGSHIHVYRSRPTYLELAPVRISKGTALEMLLKEEYDFSMNEVISFGDNYNDIELIKLSGHGVAVANSRDEVLAVANEVAPDSKADGVASVLRKYFP